MRLVFQYARLCWSFSALQRAEIAEMRAGCKPYLLPNCFSALQRAEIAEIGLRSFIGANWVHVSVLFNEPKLLKSPTPDGSGCGDPVSVLFNEPKLLKFVLSRGSQRLRNVSVLFNEPKLLKSERAQRGSTRWGVSVLFNEPKLLKWRLSRSPSAH